MEPIKHCHSTSYCSYCAAIYGQSRFDASPSVEKSVFCFGIHDKHLLYNYYYVYMIITRRHTRTCIRPQRHIFKIPLHTCKLPFTLFPLIRPFRTPRNPLNRCAGKSIGYQYILYLYYVYIIVYYVYIMVVCVYYVS